MVSKTFAWAITGVFVFSTAWWMLDPEGFTHNPVLSWLNGLTLRSQGYRR